MLKAILVVGTIFVCLFLVIGGVAGTIPLSAGIVRYIAPDPVEVNQATPFHMRVVALAQSLRSRPGEDEAQDARNTSLAIREWRLSANWRKLEATPLPEALIQRILYFLGWPGR